MPLSIMGDVAVHRLLFSRHSCQQQSTISNPITIFGQLTPEVIASR